MHKHSVAPVDFGSMHEITDCLRRRIKWGQT